MRIFGTLARELKVEASEKLLTAKFILEPFVKNLAL